MSREMSDEEIRDLLRQIDYLPDVDVTPYEANFIEDIVYKKSRMDLTDNMRTVALNIIEKYERHL